MSPDATSAMEIIRETKMGSVEPSVLEKRLGMERNRVVATLKELEKEGYGRFVLGRKGHSTRFEKAAGEPISSKPTVKKVEGYNEQVFLLTRDAPVHVRVPADLTAAEAERISKWLKVVAMESPPES